MVPSFPTPQEALVQSCPSVWGTSLREKTVAMRECKGWSLWGSLADRPCTKGHGTRKTSLYEKGAMDTTLLVPEKSTCKLSSRHPPFTWCSVSSPTLQEVTTSIQIALQPALLRPSGEKSSFQGAEKASWSSPSPRDQFWSSEFTHWANLQLRMQSVGHR